MITLEQVRLLDQKVNQAVELITSLKSENEMLKDKLESYQEKISELEVLLSGLKEDQSEVEIGFRRALDTLSAIDETAENNESLTEAEDAFEDDSEPDVEEHDESEETDTEVDDSPETETASESENAELDIF